MIELFPGKDGQVYYRIKNPKNGQTLVTSEGYVDKYNARRGVNDLMALMSRCISLTVDIKYVDGLTDPVYEIGKESSEDKD